MQDTRPRTETAQNVKTKIEETSPRLKVQPPTKTYTRKNPIYTPPKKIKESPKTYRQLYTIDEDDSNGGTTYNISNDDYDGDYSESNPDPTVIKMEYIENNSNARNIETEIQLYKCKFCPREFSKSDQLAIHSKMHIPVKKNFKCSLCPAAFNSKDLLDRHEKTHTEGLFRCRSEEELRFGNTSTIPRGNYRIIDEDEVVEDDDEVEEDLPPKKPTFIKMAYNDNTGSLGKINPEAMSNVTKDMKIFKCNMCSQAFTRPIQLERHMNVHTKAKKEYECGVCFKVFPSKSTLDRHERIHTGEKPYQCRFCSKRFVQKEILKRHESIHLEIKTFKCDQDNCDKSFSQKKQLDKHISEIHLGIVVLTRFQCHLCTKVCVTVFAY